MSVLIRNGLVRAVSSCHAEPVIRTKQCGTSSDAFERSRDVTVHLRQSAEQGCGRRTAEVRQEQAGRSTFDGRWLEQTRRGAEATAGRCAQKVVRRSAEQVLGRSCGRAQKDAEQLARRTCGEVTRHASEEVVRQGSEQVLRQVFEQSARRMFELASRRTFETTQRCATRQIVRRDCERSVKASELLRQVTKCTVERTRQTVEQVRKTVEQVQKTTEQVQRTVEELTRRVSEHQVRQTSEQYVRRGCEEVLLEQRERTREQETVQQTTQETTCSSSTRQAFFWSFTGVILGFGALLGIAWARAKAQTRTCNGGTSELLTLLGKVHERVRACEGKKTPISIGTPPVEPAKEPANPIGTPPVEVPPVAQTANPIGTPPVSQLPVRPPVREGVAQRLDVFDAEQRARLVPQLG